MTSKSVKWTWQYLPYCVLGQSCKILSVNVFQVSLNTKNAKYNYVLKEVSGLWKENNSQNA